MELSNFGRKDAAGAWQFAEEVSKDAFLLLAHLRRPGCSGTLKHRV